MEEDVRKGRQDIQLLLSTFVDDIDGFRRLMQKTGGLIVGEIATATPAGLYLDLVLCNANLDSCAKTWVSLLKGETIAPPPKFPSYSHVVQKVYPR